MVEGNLKSLKKSLTPVNADSILSSNSNDKSLGFSLGINPNSKSDSNDVDSNTSFIGNITDRLSKTASMRETDTETDSDSDSNTQSSSLPAKNSSMTFKILIAITILGLIGINLFGYAGVIIDKVNDFTGPIIRKLLTLLGFYTTETVKTTVSTAAEGTKLVADTTKNVTTAIIDTSQKQTANIRDELERTDSDIAPNIIPEVQERNEREAIIDNDGSLITNAQTTGVEGWCYVGKDNGLRHCVEVGSSDTCMSGEIFPTNEICVNPSLRY